jgi:hypothetical protein
MAKTLYGVFWGSKWGMTFDRAAAFSAVEGKAGATIRAMPDPEATDWDAPTFRVCSDQIYPEPIPAEAQWPRAIC